MVGFIISASSYYPPGSSPAVAHEVINLYAKDIPFLQITGHCYQATEALEYLSRNNVDLLFLDIQLPRIKGLDLLKILKKKPLVIITSAFGEFALESFELDVCDLAPRTLTSFEEQLPAGDFIRIHKSFIVNKQHVELLVGKNYKNAFKLIT